MIGVSLPLYVVHSVNEPLNIWDSIAIAVSVCGIIVAYHADTQLHDFVTRNSKLKELGKPMVPNLDKGLWNYSRHPNYFGEQLWWWGLVIFAWNLGHGWTFFGALVNSMCLAYVTKLVEDRMLKQDYRAEAYRLYQKTTSVWIPWFRSSTIGGKDKSNWRGIMGLSSGSYLYQYCPLYSVFLPWFIKTLFTFISRKKLDFVCA